jgi:hypothetical protein
MPKALNDLSYEGIHRAIDAAERDLVEFQPGNDVEAERAKTALRNLTIARLVLECDQSLSPLDYDRNPCGKMKQMRDLLDGKVERLKPGFR